jgi:hypothetical protein
VQQFFEICNLNILCFFREKEDDLERRFELLNRELRSILAMEGKNETFEVEQNLIFLLTAKIYVVYFG